MASNGAQILRFLCTLATSAGSYSVPKAPFTIGVRVEATKYWYDRKIRYELLPK